MKSSTTRLPPMDCWFALASDLITDMFMVYVFEGTPDIDGAVADVMQRARACPEFGLRIRFVHGFPHWIAGSVGDGHVVVHPASGGDWSQCLNTIGALITDDQLDIRRAMWRLRVFSQVTGVPGTSGPSTVAVVQVSHVLADGPRSAVLAGILFGRPDDVALTPTERRAGSLVRGIEALRWQRRLSRAIEEGSVPPPPPPVPALSTNTKATGAVLLRTLVRRRSQMPCPERSVTIGALIAVSEALSGYLRARHEDVSMLTALVPISAHGLTDARNRSIPEFVRLYPDVAIRGERAALIAADLEGARLRRQHPAFAAKQRALSTLPAALMRRVATRTHPEMDEIFANTGLSSVYRGPADLTFGDCPVVMTAGYPYLTPKIGLAHGVHGIGDTVAISVHTAESVMPDIDEYIGRLNDSLHP